MPTATATPSRNSADRAGTESGPRSPAAVFPAGKFSWTGRTPASSTDRTKASTSRSPGTTSGKGHHESTAPRPAAAAPDRAPTATSGQRIEVLTA